MTTEVFRVPLVASHDYDALRELIREAPPTHHEWVDLFRRRTSEERRSGRAIHEMHLDPHRFADHARLKGYPTNLATLERFLSEIDPHRSDQSPPMAE